MAYGIELLVPILEELKDCYCQQQGQSTLLENWVPVLKRGAGEPAQNLKVGVYTKTPTDETGKYLISFWGAIEVSASFAGSGQYFVTGLPLLVATPVGDWAVVGGGTIKTFALTNYDTVTVVTRTNSALFFYGPSTGDRWGVNPSPALASGDFFAFHGSYIGQA